MSDSRRCPNCGAGGFQPAGSGRLRCTACGTELAFRMAWLPWLLTWALAGAALSLGLSWAGGWLGLGTASTRLALAGALTGALATTLAGRFRVLRKA